MSVANGKLTALKVSKTNEPGMYGDGGNLWLQVSTGGGKSWILRYRIHGRDRYMGLGSVRDVSLAEARAKATEARKHILEGQDPIDVRESAAMAARIERAKLVTFAQCAVHYMDAHRAGWSNHKHAQQWKNTLSAYAFPFFGDLPVAEVDTALVVKCLEPVWREKPETATRLRGRIEAILDSCCRPHLATG